MRLKPWILVTALLNAVAGATGHPFGLPFISWFLCGACFDAWGTMEIWGDYGYAVREVLELKKEMDDSLQQFKIRELRP